MKFLHVPKGKSLNNAYHLLPKIFLIHSMLAEKLNMNPDEAERWIVNLVRNARLDAKIDSKQVSTCNSYKTILASEIFHGYGFFAFSDL